ncbi:MAG: hypothetical protein UT63_C0024G0002 [Candidatus Gottesmanbacteria bacterium GW2011_GWC2_39_8]|uniref:Uncharacterized protein n=1 Tax=Candidatus Gottesmanbacteria bacterium GW2011_GWC2_39_8 TaxID=1618450 RepID=A0A0G0SEC1_9BACT|nr:MAG: hypothetical protein UT63_C0024G0002 [Candidatus Gottesmanbacteria bacterium GW2011_GWC2_39_8]
MQANQIEYSDYPKRKGTFIDWVGFDKSIEISVHYASGELNKKLNDLVKNFKKNPDNFPKLDDNIWK